MKVLIPLLSKRENDNGFLEKAAEKAKEIIVFLPVDTGGAATSGFTMAEIAQGQKLMEEIKAKIGRKRKKCEGLLEWGGTVKNIDHIARLRGVETIALVRQDNEFFRVLLKELKKNRHYKVRVIEAAGLQG